MFIILPYLLQLIPKFISSKNPDLTVLSLNKPRHTDWLEKKEIWVEKPSNGSPGDY